MRHTRTRTQINHMESVKNCSAQKKNNKKKLNDKNIFLIYFHVFENFLNVYVYCHFRQH